MGCKKYQNSQQNVNFDKFLGPPIKAELIAQ